MRVGLAAWAKRLLRCLLLLAGISPAWADDADLCRAAIAATERATFIPDRLMQAIGIMESGRRSTAGVVQPWPWTINVEGVGEVFDSKPAAIAAVQAHQARGARSIDIGCMQVNLLHHGKAFASLDQAFDPVANARYAAGFLQQLLAQTGSWPRAVAGYHSLTPDIGGEYAKKVLAIWARPELGRGGPVQPLAVTPLAATAPASAAAGGSTLPSMPGGMGARVTAGGGSGAAAMTNRGLDSYRAMPTRLATSGMFRRG